MQRAFPGLEFRDVARPASFAADERSTTLCFWNTCEEVFGRDAFQVAAIRSYGLSVTRLFGSQLNQVEPAPSPVFQFNSADIATVVANRHKSRSFDDHWACGRVPLE